MRRVVGIDFGTTNSVIAVAEPDGQVCTARFAVGTELLDVFRTVLCFWLDETRVGSVLRHEAGPAAIGAWLGDAEDSRLIMSMKSYLAQRSFSQTRIFGRPFALEQLVALFLRGLLASAAMPMVGARVVAGRPVRFVGETADDAFGEARLRTACAQAGLGEIDIALEPEAAGWRFARSLTAPATVLIGDFGGGTSDFSLLRFEPGAGRRVVPLGYAGVGIAGDSFDARIIDHVVSPCLGKGDTYRVMGTDLPVPAEFYTSFSRWHRLSVMRAPRTLRDIREVAACMADPRKLGRLISLVEDEAGYGLYRTVAAAKALLSREEHARLRFAHKDFRIDAVVGRADFEAWIAPDLARIGGAIEQAMRSAGVAEAEVDHVFLTGGTSFVPAVRRLFTGRFGAERVSAGGEFVSVAEGLALIGRDRDG